MIKVPAEHPTLTIPGQRIMIVGEAPGEKEELHRRPFAGPSGDFLNSRLTKVGLLRSQCWITNVCKYRPPANNLTAWFKGGDANPKYQLIKDGVTELFAEITQYDPTVIVALGNYALWALTGLGRKSPDGSWSGIAQYRGSILPSHHTQTPSGYRQVKVIPSYHPAFVLRQFKWAAVSHIDFQRIKDESTSIDIQLPPIKINLLEGPSQVERELNNIPSNTSIASDIECDRNRCITTISFAVSPNEALVIPFRGKHGYLYDPHTEGLTWRSINHNYQRFTNHGGQNFMFDRMILAARYRVYTPTLAFDNLIASKIAVPEFPAGLDFQTSVWTRRPYYKDEGKDWSDPQNWDAFYRYNGLDSCVTWEARQHLERELLETGNMRIFRMVMMLQDALFAMNLRGLQFDQQAALNHITQINHDRGVLERIVFGVLGTSFNIASEKQMKDVLYTHLGYKPKKSRSRTSKSGITSDELAILKCDLERPDPILDFIIGWKKLTKQLSFVEARPHSPDDPTDPLHGRITYFLQSSTETGRLACRSSPLLSSIDDDAGSKLNLQTIPHDLRDVFVPPPGRVFVYSDLSQAEARRVAWLSNDAKMQGLFLTGQDVHKFNASLCLRKPVETIQPVERQACKRIVHGTNYKMGPQTMQDSLLKDGFRISLGECKNARDAYLAANPRIEYWHGELARTLSLAQPLENAFGRRRRFFGRFNDEQTLMEAIAFLPQGEVADQISLSIIAIEFGTTGLRELGYWTDADLPPLYPDVLLHLQVHDALLWSCEASQIDRLIPEVTKRMLIPIATHGQTHTIPVEHQVSSQNWADCK